MVRWLPEEIRSHASRDDVVNLLRRRDPAPRLTTISQASFAIRTHSAERVLCKKDQPVLCPLVVVTTLRCCSSCSPVVSFVDSAMRLTVLACHNGRTSWISAWLAYGWWHQNNPGRSLS